MEHEPDAGGGTPMVGYCDPVADWPASWIALEEQVLELMNQQRSRGADCGAGGTFEAAAPLVVDPALRCAARAHSKDMSDRSYFDHQSPEGELPPDRVERAGYTYLALAENIALGPTTAEAAMAGWLDSPGHCGNIMGSQYEDVGVGYHDGAYWTVVFGAK